MSEITLRVTRRQAAMIGALLEADLQERGVLPDEGLGDDQPTFVYVGPPWYPTVEENQEDLDLFRTVHRLVESPGAVS